MSIHLTRVHKVTTYQTLDDYLAGFAAGDVNLLILLGNPGLAKSRLVQAALPEARLIESHATAFALYQELFAHRDMPVVIDDVDSLYADKACVRLLKSVAQTNAVKTVSWNSQASKKSGVPQSFTTSSPVVIIANEWQTTSKNVAALERRGQIVSFEPTTVEIHRYVSGWFWDQEIYDFVSEHAHLIDEFSCRHYLDAVTLKRIASRRPAFDWKRNFLACHLDGTRLAVANLLSDKSFTSQKARIAAFSSIPKKQGGGSRPTFFGVKKRLEAEEPLPWIKLARTSPPDEDDDDGDDLLDRLRRRAGRE